jgi:c(7)-type cytochrome triheme protein
LKAAILLSLLVVFGLVVNGSVSAAETPATTKPKTEEKATTAPATTTPAKKTGVSLDPTDPTSVIYLDTSGKPAGVGDPNNPPGMAYKIGRGWHPQALSAAGLSKDKYGLIDWAKLVRDKVIKPRHSLNEADEEMPALKMDVLILAKGDYVDDVIFPHEMHTFWLKCEVCHPKIFNPQKGSNPMSMVEIAQGQWCGRCHGKVAFPLSDCKRCHVSPKSASK